MSRSLLRAAGTVGGLTALSRMLGLTRDALMASQFGTSLAMSAFSLAFTIPNLFRRLFGEGALSAAFVPAFVRTRKEEGDVEAWLLAGRVLNLLLAFLFVVVIVAEVALFFIEGSGLLSQLGATMGPRVEVALPFTRIMLPYAMFICAVALCMGMLNAHQRFALPAATPCLLNLVWIFAAIVIAPRFGMAGIAWAILAAGVLQFLIQFPALFRLGFRPVRELGWSNPKVRRVVVIMLPAAGGAAVTQVNVVIDRLLAYGVSDYAAAALFYSERLIYLPLGIFATALGTVLLPTLSRQADDRAEVGKTVMSSLRTLLFVMVPAAVGLAVLAGPIIQMLLGWGEFGAASVAQTTIALQCYAPGLVMFSLAKVFVPAFYGMQDTKTPVMVAAGCVVLNLGLNLLFIATWPEGTKHAGIAMGTVVAEAVFAAILAWILHRRIGLPGAAKTLWSVARFFVAAAAMAAASMGMLRLVRPLVGIDKLGQSILVLSAITVGMMVYAIVARLIRCPEFGEVASALRRR